MGFRLIDQNPGHVQVQLFSGRNPGSRGLLGVITERADEWPELRGAFLRGGFEEMPSLVKAVS